MRIRPLIGWVLSFGILTVSGFLVFVGITSSVNTQPMSLIPSLLGLVVGLFLCLRVPDNNVGPVVLVAVLSFSVVGSYALVRDWGIANGHPLFAMIAEIAGEMAFSGLLTALLILLPIWFPDGVASSRWSGWVARAGMVFMSLAVLVTVLRNRVCIVSGPEGGFDCSRSVANPWGIPGLDGSVAATLNAGLFLLTIPAVIAAVLRWRRSTGVQRAQLKWFTLAAVPFVADFLFTVVNLRFVGTDLAAWSRAVTLSGVWLSIGLAVAKYRLYDIDRIISRTVGYALVIVALGSVYVVGAVWLPIRLMGEQPPLFVAGSTLVVAALFNPLRRRVLVWVDRRFYRSQYDARRVVDQFGDHLREGSDVNQLITEAVAVVGEVMRPSAVGVWVHDHTE